MSIQGQADPKAVAAEERRYKAFEMKKAGATYRQVASQLGVSVRQAFLDVKWVLVKLHPPQESIESFRNMEIDRLESYLLRLQKEISSGNMAAMDRALRISNQIADLRGLKAPIKQSFVDQAGKDVTPIVIYLPDNKRAK